MKSSRETVSLSHTFYMEREYHRVVNGHPLSHHIIFNRLLEDAGPAFYIFCYVVEDTRYNFLKITHPHPSLLRMAKYDDDDQTSKVTSSAPAGFVIW